jgi:SpoVK/Ycf46/Vps4 family AAA+-type ATPase
MITNREDVLDPAVLRRSALRLHFSRPDDIMRATVFRQMLEDTGAADADINKLVKASKRDIPYSISDLTDRIGRLALRRAWKENRPFSSSFIAEAIAEVEPTPLLEKRS